jgi:GT2 family glycosyltransferase
MALIMVDLSICIATLNACDYLRSCLQSIYDQSSYLQSGESTSAIPLSPSSQPSPDLSRLSFELIIVDNGSSDGTIEMLKREFPGCQLILNGRNDGFAKPVNQALRISSGEFMVVLNPDTTVHLGAFNRLVDYLKSNPDVGICGPKVLNRDGTLQKACRRGVSRPWAAFSYFLGLSSLFPKSKFFGGYLLNYLDENAIHEVDGVSGSCMMIRRRVIEQVGYFDERFFAYQEDSDYCFQVKKAGWKIVYFPQSQITHYGGQGGSRVQPYRSIYEWHRSYYLYYRKNLAKDYLFLFNWFYYCLMGLKLVVSLAANTLRSDKYAGPRRA